MKRMKAEPTAAYDDLLVEVADVVEAARHAAARSVNAVMTATYWFVGRRIVEHEQQGAARAAYGERLLGRFRRLRLRIPNRYCRVRHTGNEIRRQRLRNSWKSRLMQFIRDSRSPGHTTRDFSPSEV
jgi:hypothetical protein